MIQAEILMVVGCGQPGCLGCAGLQPWAPDPLPDCYNTMDPPDAWRVEVVQVSGGRL
jgi:hypothetical protein